LALRKKPKKAAIRAAGNKCHIARIEQIKRADNTSQNVWGDGEFAIRANIALDPFNATKSALEIEKEGNRFINPASR
jgi:hypothetical protein